MERFDSAALFSIFKNEDGENLLPFDEMAALLDLGPGFGELDVPTDVPLVVNTAPMITTEGPTPNVHGNGQVLPSTSAADSAHTRAPAGWGSRPSSEGDGDSDGSDMDGRQLYQMETEEGQPSAAVSGEQPRGRGGKGTKATSAAKKRRQRNTDQMESNRVAQQKYRQRKKQEQSVLQQAVDLLTAQVAALKAVEVRAGELEASNAALEQAVQQQAASIVVLHQQTTEQASTLAATRAALFASQEQVTAQNNIILNQQAKLALQEQVIVSLKDRLKERIDEAMLHVVPGTVCEKMVAAVKATLYDAKDVHGLQEILSKLPEHLVNELCKNIFHVCKESWPEMRARCGQQANGHSCMTGAT